MAKEETKRRITLVALRRDEDLRIARETCRGADLVVLGVRSGWGRFQPRRDTTYVALVGSTEHDSRFERVSPEAAGIPPKQAQCFSHAILVQEPRQERREPDNQYRCRVRAFRHSLRLALPGLVAA